MSKITLSSVGSLIDSTTAENTINNNFTVIQSAFDDTLSRDGTFPNQMENPLDMNSFQIINLPPAATAQSPLRLQDLNTFIGGGTITNIPPGGTIHQVLNKTSNVDYQVGWTNSITSVGLTTPADLTVIGSPVTTAGTLEVSWTLTPTGTGAMVRAISPTLVTPILGTPTSGVLTNTTGLPLTTGVTGILPSANGGTGVNNGSNTLTLAGNLTLVGTSATILTTTGTTNSVLPAGTHTLAALDVSQTFTATQNVSVANLVQLFIKSSGANGSFIYMDTGAAGQQSGFQLLENGVDYWSFIKQATTNQFLIYSATDLVTFITCSPGGGIILAPVTGVSVGTATDPGAKNLVGGGSIKSLSPSGGLGYATGAGGAVTQITSRTTGVTLNTVCGAITMFSAAGSATAASFTVTNSAVAATDTVHLAQQTGTNLYNLSVTAVAAGSFRITYFTTGGVSVDAPVINFAVIKGVTS